jgi:hypothetical protein
MTIESIIARAKRTGRVQNNLVLCDNCDTPASEEYSKVCGWTGCAPCITGEADTLDPDDFITVEAVEPRDPPGWEGGFARNH